MREKIMEILQEVKDDVDFTEDMDFIDAGLLDSFDIVSLVDELEAAFDIEIPGVEIIPDNFVNVDAICELVESCMGGR